MDGNVLNSEREIALNLIILSPGHNLADPVVQTLQAKLDNFASVLDFGATGDGVTDDIAAFDAAWASIKNTGGTLIVPPATYYLNATWLIDTAGKQYIIKGSGAVLLSGPSVTGFAIDVTGGGNVLKTMIRGFYFNHITNTTVAGAIRLSDNPHTTLTNNMIVANSSSASYIGIDLYNDCFWTFITDNSIATNNIGVRLYGDPNATMINNNTFAGGVDGIRLDPDAGGTSANGVRISGNSLESLTNGITVIGPGTPDYYPTGVLVSENRCETADYFINIAGSASNSGTQTLNALNNYWVAGNTGYLSNPDNWVIKVFEQMGFPDNTSDNVITGAASLHIIHSGIGQNTHISNASGASTWQNGHLVLGTTSNPFHLWADATGDLRIKNGAPTSDTDGAIVGTQT